MVIYLLKSAGCLAMLLCFYHFVLEKEKIHKFNRFYLLGSVFFSFFVPLFEIYVEVTPQILSTVQPPLKMNFIKNSTTNIPLEKPIDYSIIFIGTYILISGLLSFRFISNLFKIINKIKNNKQEKLAYATLILVDDKVLPHSFLNYIFITKKDFIEDKIEKELLTHELTHVTQKHTIDILLMEILLIIFWINPLFIILKKAIQLNHEFLADDKVINTYKNTSQYQHLLLSKATWNNEHYLVSNLNYSLTKKRLKMMTKQNSKRTILFKKMAIIPVLSGFIFLFADRIEAQETIETIVESEFNNDNLTESEIYKAYFYKNAYVTITKPSGKKIKKKYIELTTEEKNNVPPPPPIKNKKKIPSNKLIESLKDNSKYALWIDEKVVKNDVLNTYKNSDFSNYAVSFVHKNARNERFPQENQANLYTHNYFKTENKKNAKNFKKYLESKYKVEEVFEMPQKDSLITIYEQKKSSITQKETNKEDDDTEIIEIFEVPQKVYEYDQMSKEYALQIKTYLKENKYDKTLINRTYLEIKKMYNAFTKKELKKYKILPPPPPPAKKKQTYKTSFKIIKSKKYSVISSVNNSRYFNRYGIEVDKVGNKLNGSKQVNASDVIPGQYITKIYQKNKIVSEFNNNQLSL